MPDVISGEGLRVVAATDPGRRREKNEDALAYRLTPFGGVFVVADGMGGHARGEVASRMAAEIIVEYLAEGEPSPARISEAFETANRRIYEMAQGAGYEGMGTTATALVLDLPYALIGHVGDSRGYLLRSGLLVQLTQDHSWVEERVRQGLLRPEEAKNHRWKSVITNALGTFPEVEVDLLGLRVRPGDIFVLSTDGLHGVVGEEAMARILSERPLEEAVPRLVELANAWGGPDNITLMAVQLDRVPADGNKPYAELLTGDQPVYIRSRSGDAELAWPTPPRRWRWTEVGLLVIWVLLLLYVLLSHR